MDGLEFKLFTAGTTYEYGGWTLVEDNVGEVAIAVSSAVLLER